MRKLSGDLCISRPRARLAWGIDLPFDPGYVTYVWFDALINYISFAGYLSEGGDGLPAFDDLWPANAHVIGKDIMAPPHGIYWPVMLHALGFPDEKIARLLVHGYVNIAGAKMSKSVGNIVDPVVLAAKYGPEALRYYLMRDCTVGQDMDFAEDRLVTRFNTDLANGLGNLLNRTLNMAGRYREGVLTSAPHDDPAIREVEQAAAATVEAFTARMDEYQIPRRDRSRVGFSFPAAINWSNHPPRGNWPKTRRRPPVWTPSFTRWPSRCASWRSWSAPSCRARAKRFSRN